MNSRGSGHGFETRFAYRWFAATRRGSAFYVADPLSSHSRIYTNDQTSCFMVRDSWFLPHV